MSAKTDILNSPQALQEVANGYKQSRILLSAFELDIFSILGNKARTSKEVASNIGSDQRATDRIMNALSVLGLLTKEGDLFSNSDIAAKYLSKDSPNYMERLGHASNLYKSWASLTDAVMAGTTVINNMDREWSDKEREAFIAAMHYRAKEVADDHVSLIDLTGVKSVLDIGGGSGVYSLAFARAKEDLEAVVFDLPDVTKITERYIAQSEYGVRVTTRSGNYHSGDFGSGYDLVFLSAIVHINKPLENMDLLRNIYNSLNSGGMVVIFDLIMSDNRLEPARGAFFALNMLVNTNGGDTYTESEVRSWLTEAGFISLQRIDVDHESTYIIGKKPE